MADDGHDVKDLLGAELPPGVAKSNFEFTWGPVCRALFGDRADEKPPYIVMQTQNPFEVDGDPSATDISIDRFRPSISPDAPTNK